MGEAARTLDAVYTYGDYAKWPEGERWELIDGCAWAMSPAPTVVHQRVISRMYSQLAAFLEGHQCEVLFSPVDVLLPEGDERVNDVRTVVQPDIVVVCDPDKIKDNRFIRGTPGELGFFDDPAETPPPVSDLGLFRYFPCFSPPVW